uniref:Uncharacterized protein n=1 Tax=uncultured Desulfobacterium sp. TaxID=201089 RepID=E1YAD2_9BACT|nr:unknown protein [uncultured Desulfobacterium sp.]
MPVGTPLRGLPTPCGSRIRLLASAPLRPTNGSSGCPRGQTSLPPQPPLIRGAFYCYSKEWYIFIFYGIVTNNLLKI